MEGDGRLHIEKRLSVVFQKKDDKKGFIGLSDKPPDRKNLKSTKTFEITSNDINSI